MWHLHAEEHTKVGNQPYGAGEQQSEEIVADERLRLHVDWGGHTESRIQGKVG